MTNLTSGYDQKRRRCSPRAPRRTCSAPGAPAGRSWPTRGPWLRSARASSATSSTFPTLSRRGAAVLLEGKHLGLVQRRLQLDLLQHGLLSRAAYRPSDDWSKSGVGMSSPDPSAAGQARRRRRAGALRVHRRGRVPSPAGHQWGPADQRRGDAHPVRLAGGDRDLGVDVRSRPRPQGGAEPPLPTRTRSPANAFIQARATWVSPPPPGQRSWCPRGPRLERCPHAPGAPPQGGEVDLRRGAAPGGLPPAPRRWMPRGAPHTPGVA